MWNGEEEQTGEDDGPDVGEVMQQILAMAQRTRAEQFVCRMAIVALVATHPNPKGILRVLRFLADVPEPIANGKLTPHELQIAKTDAAEFAGLLELELRRLQGRSREVQ